MVAGDDRPDFVAGGMSTSCFLGASGRGDDKLVSGKNQFRRHAFARAFISIFEQSRSPLTFRRENFGWAQNVDDVPRLGRADKRRGFFIREIDLKKSRAPKHAFMG